MPALPFHKYVGPGNDLDSGDPVDSDDVIAREHDLAYAASKSQSDIENADLHAIRDFAGDFGAGNLHSAIGVLGLSGKFAAEKLFGPIYGMSKKDPIYQPNLGLGLPSHRDHPYKETELKTQIPRPDIPFGLSSPQFDEPVIQPPDTTPEDKGKRVNKRGPANIISDIQVKKPNTKQVGVALPNSQEKSNPNGPLNDFWKNFQASPGISQGTMDVDQENGVMGAAGVKAGSGPGMGASGAAGVGAPSTIQLPTNSNCNFRHTFTQSYRWVVPACLTTQKIELVTQTEVGNDALPAQGTAVRTIKVGSSVAFNMDDFFYYIDPGTYARLHRDCAQLYVDGADLTITSLGVRAPYTTNDSALQVANSNIQAQVFDFSSIQEHYPLQQTQRYNVMVKCFGSSYPPVATDETTDFYNVSARLETRANRNRVNVCDRYYYPITGTEAAPVVEPGPEDVRPMDPTILNYIDKSINGSNHLGVAFHKNYPIKRKLQTLTGTFRPTHSNLASVRCVSQQQNLINSELYNVVPHVTLDKPTTTNDTGNPFNKQCGYLDFTAAVLSGILDNNKDVFAYEKNRWACFAMYNIRNVVNDLAEDTGTTAYNSIVDLNWETISTHSVVLEGEFITPIYYGFNLSNPGYRNKPNMVRDAGNVASDGKLCMAAYATDTSFSDAYAGLPRIAVKGVYGGTIAV